MDYFSYSVLATYQAKITLNIFLNKTYFINQHFSLLFCNKVELLGACTEHMCECPNVFRTLIISTCRDHQASFTFQCPIFLSGLSHRYRSSCGVSHIYLCITGTSRLVLPGSLSPGCGCRVICRCLA